MREKSGNLVRSKYSGKLVNGKFVSLSACPHVNPPSSRVSYRECTSDSKWINNLLFALSGGGSEEEEQHTLLNFLLTCVSLSEEFKDTYDDAIKYNGYKLPKIDGVATKAIQSLCNINRKQMSTLSSCLKMKIGECIFSSEHKISELVNMGHVEPVSGMYIFGKERIPWLYKSVAKVLLLWFQLQLDHDDNKNSRRTITHIDFCIKLDDGKGHSQISANFICRYKNADGKRFEDNYACALSNACYKKENTEIIENTFGGLLDEDLNYINSCNGLCVLVDKEDETRKVLLSQQDYHTSDSSNFVLAVEIFLASDILLYAIALGKECSTGWWYS